MKKLLTLFLVLGVLGIYGETTEGELQISADTIQNTDTISQVDTIGTENLQIEGDTASLIKDSLFTEESKKDQQEIIEKKDSSISCCLSGKNQTEQKSKWSFGIGYVGSYNYGGSDLMATYLYNVENPVWELSLYQWLTLYNYWINGIEVSMEYRLNKDNYLKYEFNYGFANRTDCGITSDKYIFGDSSYLIDYELKNITMYNSQILYFMRNNIGFGLMFAVNSVLGEETLYKQIFINKYKDYADVNRILLGLGLDLRYKIIQITFSKQFTCMIMIGITIGQTYELWNNSPWEKIWGDNKLKVNFSGINFGLQMNWGK